MRTVRLFTETIVINRLWQRYFGLQTNSLFSSRIVTRHCTHYKLSWPPLPPTSSWWSRWRPQCWCRSWCPRCRWRRRWQRRSTCLSGQNCKKCHKYLEIWQICNCHFTDPQSALQLAVQAWPAHAEVHLNWEKNPHTIVLRKTYNSISRTLEKDIWTVSGTDREYGPRQLQSWFISSIIWFRYYLIHSKYLALIFNNLKLQ